jgi:hypothetical protein
MSHVRRAGSMLATIVLTVSACASDGAPSSPSPAAPTTPVMDLVVAPTDAARPVPDAGTYTTDAASNLNECSETSDGFWRVLYAGGDPWVSVDVLVGASAVADRHSEDITAEIAVGTTTYLWIDQPQYRGGDAKGRSHAVVDVTSTDDAISFGVVATTPLRTPGGDGNEVAVDLTITCPRAG